MSQATTAEAAIRKTNFRYGVQATLFIMWMIAFIDRANVSVLITDKAFTNTLGITGNFAAQGLLTSLFLLPYGLCNFVVGPIVDRWKVRRVWGIVFILWGVLMLAMGAISSFLIMVIMRMVLGFTESPGTPVSTRLVQHWFPRRERGLATAGGWIFGLTVGPLLGLPLVTAIMLTWGWRASFFIVGGLGLVVPAYLIYRYIYDAPEDQPNISAWERDYIGQGQGERESVADPLGTIVGPSVFKKPDYWYLTLTYGMALGLLWGMTAWMPSYIHDQLHLSILSSGLFSALPWAFSLIVAVLFAPISKKLPHKAWLLSGSLIAAAVFVTMALLLHNIVGIIIFLSIGYCFVQSITIPVSLVTLQRLASWSRSGTAAGVMNGLGYVWSAVTPYLMGLLVNVTGSFLVGFMLIIFMVVIGAVAAVPVARREPGEPVGPMPVMSQVG